MAGHVESARTCTHSPRVALFNDTSVTGHFGCVAVMAALRRGVEARGATVAYRWPVATDWHAHATDLRGIPVDLLVVNGEGTIHGSAERPRARHLCALGPFARDVLDVPAHLLNATIADLAAEDVDALRAFDTITVRETVSRDYLATHGIAATVAGDLSLATPPPGPVPRDGLLVTDSVRTGTRRALRDTARRTGADWAVMQPRLPFWRRAIDKWRAPALPLTAAPDPRHARRLADFLARLSARQGVVTGRFHTVCLALLTGTPVLALHSNSPKIAALLTDALGSASRVIPLADLERSDLPAMAMRPYTRDEQTALTAWRARIAAAQEAGFDAVFAR